VGERAAEIFPFAVAVVLPPAGLLLGLFTLQEDRGQGVRLIVVASLAAVIWILLVLGAS
jgi:hypothetical protein